jgi:hypothetical protein
MAHGNLEMRFARAISNVVPASALRYSLLNARLFNKYWDLYSPIPRKQKK